MQEAGHPPIVGGHGGVPCTPQCSPAPLGGTWGLWVVSCGSPTPQCSLTPLWGSWGSPPVQHGPSPGVLGGFLGVSPHSSAAWPCSRGLGAVSQPPPPNPSQCSRILLQWSRMCLVGFTPPPIQCSLAVLLGGSHPCPIPSRPQTLLTWEVNPQFRATSHSSSPALTPQLLVCGGGSFWGLGGPLAALHPTGCWL